MTTHYLDTSALSKRYVQETGTTWVRKLADPMAGHTLLTARITMVEIYSALARRRREGSVPVADCNIATQAFTAHSATEYEFVDMSFLTRSLVSLALLLHFLKDLKKQYGWQNHNPTGRR